MAEFPGPQPQRLLEDNVDVYKLLVSSVRDYAIFLLDHNGVVRTWNAGAEAAKRYSPHEIIGRHFSTFYTPEDQAAGLPEKLLNLAKERGRIEDEGWRVRKDGSRFWADVVLTAIYDESGKLIGFAKVTRDLTERRHLVREREEAMQASSAKSAFIANMSHELRTPLTAILGYAEMLDELAEELSPASLREHLAKILYSGRHLQSLISDILDLSKIEANRLELHYTEVNVRDVIRDVISNITPLAECNTNTLMLKVEEDLPTLLTDGTRLRQILYNLLSNATKFTHSGTILTEAGTEFMADKDWLNITVIDSGIGMTPEDAALVFDRFRQVETHVAQYNKGGTGLGLAICKLLAEALGGRISVVSTVGKGSAFTVRLPLAPADSIGQRDSMV